MTREWVTIKTEALKIYLLFLLGSHVALFLPWIHYVAYVNKGGFELLI